MRLAKTILFCLFICFTHYLKGQDGRKSKLELMQGTWENIMNSETEKAYTIIKGKNSLNFVYSNKINELNFPLSESIEGFYNGDVEADSLNVDSLNEDGLRYTIINKKSVTPSGWVYWPDYLMPAYFECDGELMSINGGQLVEYSKREELPFEALDKLYKRGQLDKRDYLKEYLNLNLTAIKPLNCFVYSKPTKRTNLQLNKDHVVIIIGQTSKWLKIKYDENAIGWIRKEDAN